ncbi:MAG: RNA pseudouridine synthase, partial [Paracoccus sp. (in: a-proteobacteria)]|nr:RNA pseudouridine synthase [Paracoccus sp. (in: a-proteobacteria)]
MSDLILTIPEGVSDRLDKLLPGLAPEEAALSRSRLAKLIAAGAVEGPGGTVADGKMRASGGEIYRITLPPPETIEAKPQ